MAKHVAPGAADADVVHELDELIHKLKGNESLIAQQIRRGLLDLSRSLCLDSDDHSFASFPAAAWPMYFCRACSAVTSPCDKDATACPKCGAGSK